MVNENEVSNAVNLLKQPYALVQDHKQSIQILLSLAEEWLAAGKDLPHEVYCDCADTGHQTALTNWNNAISACRLAVAKGYVPKERLLSEDEIQDCIEDVEQERFLARSVGVKHFKISLTKALVYAQQEKMEGKA